ncbi:PLP-dependent transferase [Lentibacter sp. XHP0401]|jgi:cystathionine gamma-lyase|uniref:PLP-dependent transferase n=1 Tax=Lentibacter sp. XHP0401 TaxID=2984334 RepID=UPI0021E7EAEE|nr:PLP-dependent transferase [Lentibacter sp. XHP0401]MCV2891908.1 PLP-dependent transferase [Lentibacter sp. XHP0401]
MSLPDPIQSRLLAMLHTRTEALEAGDPVPEPLVLSSAFSLPHNPDARRTYARFTNPTIEATEARLAALEAAPCLLFPSGMGAYSAAFMALLKAGDTVLMLSDGYYAARNLVSDIMAPFGLKLVTCPAADILEADLAGIAAVVVETPSNPGLDIIDIAALSTRCHAAGAKLVVDNTVCTPLLQQPLDLGADIVIVSDTKAMAGHTDLLMGHVASRDAAYMERLLSVRNLTGNIPAPHEAWLLLRGLETVEIRLSRMCENARAVLPLLKASAAVQSVIYPASHAQALDQGFLIGATFASSAAADSFLSHAGFTQTTSFGGLHSSGDRRARWGDAVPEGFLRLSFGIEPTEALVGSIKTALGKL